MADGRRAVGRITSRAQEYARDPQKLVALLDDAAKASRHPRSGRLGDALEDLKAIVRMVLAHTRGEREIPREKLLLAIGALVWFLSPFDIIPEFLGPLGLTDDALVLAFLFRSVREELDGFLDWEADRLSLPAAEVIEVTKDGPGRS